MTISKGSSYGEPGSLPADAVVCGSDAEARAALEEARRSNMPYPTLGLSGGDLCRTLGGTGKFQVKFPVDLGMAMLDGRLHLFVAHAIARNPWWTRSVVAMNAQWLGPWNLGPKAHPNDGLLDVYDSTLTIGDLPKVRSRLHHGAHLPHPRIKEQRRQAVQVTLARPLPVRLDGVLVGRFRDLSLRVEPDALTVVV